MWLGNASELSETERRCTCCDRPLRGRIRYLELDQRTGSYHDLKDVPEEQSQGWFPFGKDCARYLNVKELARRTLAA